MSSQLNGYFNGKSTNEQKVFSSNPGPSLSVFMTLHKTLNPNRTQSGIHHPLVCKCAREWVNERPLLSILGYCAIHLPFTFFFSIQPNFANYTIKTADFSFSFSKIVPWTKTSFYICCQPNHTIQVFGCPPFETKSSTHKAKYSYN